MVTGFPRDFHSGELNTNLPSQAPFTQVTALDPVERARRPSSHQTRSFLGRQNAAPALRCPPLWRSLKAEVSCLRKDLLEVLAKTPKPFEDHCPRMQTPWPGSISEVLMLCCNRCRMAHERFTNPAATHCSRLIFYSTDRGSTQGRSVDVGPTSFAELWDARRHTSLGGVNLVGSPDRASRTRAG